MIKKKRKKVYTIAVLNKQYPCTLPILTFPRSKPSPITRILAGFYGNNIVHHKVKNQLLSVNLHMDWSLSKSTLEREFNFDPLELRRSTPTYLTH